MQKGKVWFDKGCTVVDLTHTSKYNQCDIKQYAGLYEGVLSLTFVQRNFLFIDHRDLNRTQDAFMPYLGDVHPLDSNYIQEALSEYITSYEKPVKNWLGRVVGYETVKCLKNGWIELKPNNEQTIITSNYRIIRP